MLSQENNLKQNELMQFAGKLKDSDANDILKSIQNDKNSKDFELDL